MFTQTGLSIHFRGSSVISHVQSTCILDLQLSILCVERRCCFTKLVSMRHTLSTYTNSAAPLVTVDDTMSGVLPSCMQHHAS